MENVNDRILVKVNMAQKDTMLINGIKVSTATRFETNYREKSPVIAVVVSGNKFLPEDDIICCHHNHFYHPSPYFLQDDLYSIPFNHTIFGVFDSEGKLKPVCGNVLCDKIDIETTIPLPPEQRKQYIDRYKITHCGWTKYKQGQLIFARPHSGYDIVYNWDNIEKRVTKVNSEMILGYVKQ